MNDREIFNRDFMKGFKEIQECVEKVARKVLNAHRFTDDDIEKIVTSAIKDANVHLKELDTLKDEYLTDGEKNGRYFGEKWILSQMDIAIEEIIRIDRWEAYFIEREIYLDLHR